MPDSVTVQFRGLAAQDFLTNTTFAQVTATIMGVGNVLVTPIVTATSDADAGTKSVPVGAVYLNIGGSFPYLATRLS